MGVSFDYDYGKSALNANNDRGVYLVSDGKTLAMQWDQHSFLMSGFAITALNVESITQNVNFWGETDSRRIETGKVVHLQLSSVGPVKVGPASALDNLFLNANDLSVDELLKLAYQKINARAEAEDNIIINPIEEVL
jgi:hypothetical protein